MTAFSNFEVRAPAFAGVVGKSRLIVASESPADSGARERLLDEAFGAARFEKTVERLREGRLPAQGLAVAAKDAGNLVGTLRMWHILAGEVPALLLGPLAVAKAYRSRGLGRRFMAEALFRAASTGHPARRRRGLLRTLRLFPPPHADAFSSRPRRCSALSRARTQRRRVEWREGPRDTRRRARFSGASRNLRIAPRGLGALPPGSARVAKSAGKRQS